jgi:integrase
MHRECTHQKCALGGAYRYVTSRAAPELRRKCREAGVPETHWRGLRHTCLTLMAEDTGIHIVQRWAGHAKLRTTQIYLHRQQDDFQDAIGRRL